LQAARRSENDGTSFIISLKILSSSSISLYAILVAANIYQRAYTYISDGCVMSSSSGSCSIPVKNTAARLAYRLTPSGIHRAAERYGFKAFALHKTNDYLYNVE
jgi:hypothetical protein